MGRDRLRDAISPAYADYIGRAAVARMMLIFHAHPVIPPAPFMSDPLNKEAERLVAALREAARQAGLRRDDPMAPLVLAFIETIKFLSERTALSDRIASDASRRIAKTVSQSRQAADAETKRFRAALAKTEADTVQRIATAIVETADAAWTRRVRVFDRNTAMLAASFYSRWLQRALPVAPGGDAAAPMPTSTRPRLVCMRRSSTGPTVLTPGSN